MAKTNNNDSADNSTTSQNAGIITLGNAQGATLNSANSVSKEDSVITNDVVIGKVSVVPSAIDNHSNISTITITEGKSVKISGSVNASNLIVAEDASVNFSGQSNIHITQVDIHPTAKVAVNGEEVLFSNNTGCLHYENSVNLTGNSAASPPSDFIVE
jgi:hypothetical protein